MALGVLLVFCIILFVIAVVLVTLLFVSKKAKTCRNMIWISAMFSFFIAFTSATSLPSNYVTQQGIAWIFAGIAGIGLVFHYKQRDIIAKFLISISIVLGITQLFFF